jgi:uncharacterized membrane protein
MAGFKTEIYKVVRSVVGYSSATLAAIYTIGHIFIAMICTYLITGATLELAATNAIVEPCVNGVWFYILYRSYDSFRKEAK